MNVNLGALIIKEKERIDFQLKGNIGYMCKDVSQPELECHFEVQTLLCKSNSCFK